jgi:hypothetical protein
MLLLIAAVALLCGGAAMATNGSTTETKADRLSAIEAKIEQAQAQKDADFLKALEKELTPMEKDWGIKFYGIKWTAAGYMLHLRFRVLDPEKAYPLLSRKIKRQVIVEKSGAVLKVPFSPKVGSLRSTVRTPNMVKKGRNYEALFANPGRHVKPGDKVDLVIGNFMVENIIVQ